MEGEADQGESGSWQSPRRRPSRRPARCRPSTASSATGSWAGPMATPSRPPPSPPSSRPPSRGLSSISGSWRSSPPLGNHSTAETVLTISSVVARPRPRIRSRSARVQI
ncbi:hypothetical protein ZEAMMB73_Zm00001d027788 [Zea mays]|uniref:Uncharacterized protein n=1 Tax=Zea mays TaxID=4577 RepID=A0A1D6JPJ6_MAIZE|nr:hypothetical protein ZEAMMB73_Zm00001d027788 [Zea mays]ONL93917.1 hypothetical protein ZEAMMB73_Zm00001d027788 [Zea mays]ONL93918.1 hypothetical protein ZEAMMB73_Zm00001d027788 [Zea mays]ONL93921.1 hypothetical protein ZEAMMB73_Zm00001d027788 [Zea mays]ONL93922.1 hypothetical protein ZEAMMB73_Zm00001d027788 [Zea mays]